MKSATHVVVIDWTEKLGRGFKEESIQMYEKLQKMDCGVYIEFDNRDGRYAVVMDNTSLYDRNTPYKGKVPAENMDDAIRGTYELLKTIEQMRVRWGVNHYFKYDPQKDDFVELPESHGYRYYQ